MAIPSQSLDAAHRNSKSPCKQLAAKIHLARWRLVETMNDIRALLKIGAVHPQIWASVFGSVRRSSKGFPKTHKFVVELVATAVARHEDGRAGSRHDVQPLPRHSA
jgi:hypothetical protein